MILLRFLLVRHYYHGNFYNDEFEVLRRWALKLATRSRGLDLSDFCELLVILKDEVEDLQGNIDSKIRPLFES